MVVTEATTLLVFPAALMPTVEEPVAVPVQSQVPTRAVPPEDGSAIVSRSKLQFGVVLSVKVCVPWAVGVPVAVRVMVCDPVPVKVPEAVKVTPLATAEMSYVPVVETLAVIWWLTAPSVNAVPTVIEPVPVVLHT